MVILTKQESTLHDASYVTLFNLKSFLFSNSLGLLSDEPVVQQKSPLDTLCLYLTEKLAYGKLKRLFAFTILILSLSLVNILTL